MNDINRISISNFVSENLILFGADVNNSRQLPNLYDGLKPSYRRVIYTALELGNRMKTVTLAGTCISRYHPHGESSLLQPISNLVNCGILNGGGNHGLRMLRGNNLAPAAPRYTEVWSNDKYKSIFKDLINYVPMNPSELEGFTEPDYLPTPVPLCFLTGLLGIGFGVLSRIPSFSSESLLNAYFNDDPNLLEPSTDLILDKDASELSALWNNGLGRLTYKFKVTNGRSASGDGYYISGDPLLFKPNLSKLEKLVNEGKIFINDETDSNGQRIFISRNYNVKSLSWEHLKSLCDEASTNTRMYRLTVSDGDHAFLIPLKEWMKVTVTNYLKLLETYKSDRVKKYEFDKQIYTHLPEVAKYLFEHKESSNEEISKVLSIDKEVVSAIMGKSISVLRKSETTSKIDFIDAKIKEFTDLDGMSYLKKIAGELK